MYRQTSTVAVDAVTLEADCLESSGETASPPLITQCIIGSNVLLFIAGIFFTHGWLFGASIPDLITWGANFGPLTLHGQWWRVLTSAFLHIGFLHLGLNMWVLFQVGPLVEDMFGRVRFALLYVLAGISGGVASAFAFPPVISAGASGAIFGLVGAILAYLIVLRRSLYRAAVKSLARSAGLFIVLNLAFGFIVPNVDFRAHLGGLAGGFLAGCLLTPRD